MGVLDEFEEIAAAAHVTASKTVVCPPDIHRFEVYGSSGCLETEKARGANFEPAYVRLRLLGVGLRTPYDAPGWDGCKWDPFGVTTLVDREKRVVVVVNAADIVEYMDAESCNASGMYVDEYMLNAGKMSLISGARSVWGWPITWPFERRHLVKKAARLATRRLIRDLDEDLVKFKVGKKSDDGGDADAPQGVGEWLGGDKLSVGDCYWHVAAARSWGSASATCSTATRGRREPRAPPPELRKATYLWAGADDFPLPLLGPVVREARYRRSRADAARAAASYAARGSAGTALLGFLLLFLYVLAAQVNIDNDAFIERWRGAERPVNAPGLLITVDADHALPADATCFAKRDCVVLWKGFVPPEIVENLTRIEPRMFKDSNYSFMRIGGAEVKGDRVFRSFATHGMREGMRRMIAGENIQLGFDVKMADENPWLKNIGLELLAKVNAFDSSVMYLAQSFLYHGNQQQANLHNDPLSGFSIQLANSKLWRFVNPRHTPRVRPFRGDNPGVFYSDLCFLENGTIPFLEVLVEPGDMIFFPGTGGTRSTPSNGRASA
ncbi:hypothetical protein JL720_17243 [Aureococcus anophagefferens]|nr:hypothetical protein JL720_17243 [Aureococcus anophagefferens]